MGLVLLFNQTSILYNLLYFLSHFSDTIKEIDRNTFYGKKIAVDISILIYQVVIASKNHESKLTSKTGEMVSHILGLFNKSMIYDNIYPDRLFTSFKKCKN